MLEEKLSYKWSIKPTAPIICMAWWISMVWTSVPHSPSINQAGGLPTNSFHKDGGTNGLTGKWERGQEAE